MESENTSPSRFRIGIAGLGLIGGSLAMSFKECGCTVYGYDIDAATVARALESGAISRGSTDQAVITGVDILFVALYPDDIVPFLRQTGPLIKKGTLVVDCCGIKGYICGQAEQAAKENGFVFIGGHPMAGTEKNGFSAATSTLFEHASFILTPPDSAPGDAVNLLSGLLRTAGFGKIVITTPKHHDRMIAFTSQLPHVLACAYVKSPSCSGHKGYSAGSFRDVSRVAHINAELWSELFIDNKTELIKEIDILTDNITRIRNAVDAGDRALLSSLLKSARDTKDSV